MIFNVKMQTLLM